MFYRTVISRHKLILITMSYSLELVIAQNQKLLNLNSSLEPRLVAQIHCMHLHMIHESPLCFLHARTRLGGAAPIYNTKGLIAESKEKWVEDMVVMELFLTTDTYHFYSQLIIKARLIGNWIYVWNRCIIPSAKINNNIAYGQNKVFQTESE